MEMVEELGGRLGGWLGVQLGVPRRQQKLFRQTRGMNRDV